MKNHTNNHSLCNTKNGTRTSKESLKRRRNRSLSRNGCKPPAGKAAEQDLRRERATDRPKPPEGDAGR